MFNRRAFLKLAGMSSVAVAGSALASPLDTLKFDKTLYKTSSTRLLMGTFVNITVFHPSVDQAEEAVEQAFALIARKENTLTRFSESSPVGALNKEGVLYDLEPDVARTITLSFHFNRISSGAFDITVKPIIDIVKNSFQKNNKPPDNALLEDALTRVGMKNMKVFPDKVVFDKEGMGVTLDGIAKGYIADQAAEFLKKSSIKHALVNAGGDIRLIGGKGNGKPWRIAIRDPEKQEKYASVIRIMEGAVATSGNYEIYFDQEKTFHHIVDPKSGRSPVDDQSVTTVCASTVEADALSTAVFVMNPTAGISFLQGLPGVEGMVINRKGRRVSTNGWKKLMV